MNIHIRYVCASSITPMRSIWLTVPFVLIPKQAMVEDLLSMEDDMITFMSDGKGGRHETKALLNDSDHLWVEFRHQHIAKVGTRLRTR